MSLRVVAVGDLVADLVLEIPALPVQPGQAVEGRGARLEPGGAGNFLVAARRLGMAAAALGALGEDALGLAVARALEREGVDVSRVALGPGTTTAVVVLADALGRHAFVGAFGEGPPTEVTPEWEDALRRAHAVFLPGYACVEPRMAAAAPACAERAAAAGVPVLFDPGPHAARIPQEVREAVLARSAAVLVAEEELALLGCADPRGLLASGPRVVVVKRGARGCTVFTGRGRVDVPGFPVAAADAAGAGDCFAAAFAYGWLRHGDPERAAVLGNAMGAAMAARRGTGTQAPGAAEVAELLRRFRPDVTL